MTTPERLPAGIYLSPRHDGMVVMVDTSGFPRPVSEDYETLVNHNGRAHVFVKLWGPLAPAKVVPADAIVIDRTDLPEVTVSPDGRIQARGATLHNGTATGDDALGWLAIDEHLKAHPPIDEAAVDALQRALADLSLDNRLAKADVRALVAAGVRAPQAGDDQ